MSCRMKELESFFNRFPDVPREVILKEDVLRWGMTFSDAALEVVKDGTTKSYRLFSHDKVGHDKLSRGEQNKVPEELRLVGGLYTLKPTVVRVALATNSPYHVDVVEEKLVLTEAGRVICAAEFAPRPKYYAKKFEDGALYWEVVPLLEYGTLCFATVYKICQHWGHKDECGFCDINQNVRQKQRYGGGFSLPQSIKPVDKVATVIEEIFNEKKETPENRIVGICLSGGAILSKLNGQEEIDFYLSYANAIKEKIGNKVPLRLQIGAKGITDLKALKAGGIDCIDENMEVWDERLFKLICPGKERLIGRENWIRALLDSVECFGEGNVTPNFVAGVEMARPYGFTDVSSAVASTLEGFDFLMRHGVTPRMNQWSRGELSDLCREHEQPIPPLEYFVRIVIGWYELWKKYNLPPVRGFGPMGIGRATYQQSSIFDLVGT